MSLRRIVNWLTSVASYFAPLALRIALALPFFRSGLTKWDAPGRLSPSASYLFSEEFRLHLLGQTVPFPAPLLFAYVDGAMEIVLPLLLLLGLSTRFSALGLLVMTGVIQLVVPGGWEMYHLPWAAMALGLIAMGPGRISLDHLIGRHFPATQPGPTE